MLVNTKPLFFLALLLVGLLATFITVYAATLTVSSTATLADGVGGFTELDGAVTVTTVVIGNSTYALVGSDTDDGIQIINFTTPSNSTSITAVAALTDESGGFTELDAPYGITTVVIGNSTYALVAAFNDDGVQIIDITTPSSPNATAAITDESGGFTELNGAYDITTVVIGNSTYALVASLVDNGVQIIDITTPSSPNATAAITDGVGGFTRLQGANGIATVSIGSSTYALVSAEGDNGVQIIDITTPSSPTATAAITDGVGGFTRLNGAYGITTVVIDGTKYALVAAQYEDGFQIINISTPSSPTATAAVSDEVGGFTKLDGAIDVASLSIGDSTYALVTALNDDGVQIIDITTPSSPTATAAITDGVDGFTELDSPYGITTVSINGHRYALIAAFDDDGVQIIKITSSLITNTVTAGVSVTETLPAQGTLEIILPSTKRVSFTLPSGISGNVTAVTTNSGTSDTSISFLGTVVDFTTASCTGGCTVAFNFTQAELTTSGFSSSDIKVFHDSSGDGNFQTSEALTTTISTFSGGFTATASTPSTSKFAIGGVVGATANAAAGIGAAGHFLGFLKDNCDESGFGQGQSLRVYEISYDKCDANQITILADTTCGPMKVFVGKENNRNVAGMSSVQPYLNDEKRMIILNSPITSDVTEFSVVAKDNRDEFYEKIYANQCSATKQYSFTTGYTSEQNNAMSVLLPDWIKNNAKWWSSDEIDDQTFVNGIRYLIQHDVMFIQKNITTENTDNTIPDWIKNNAKWWSSDEIDDQTFVNGIQYLVNNGIIKVD